MRRIEKFTPRPSCSNSISGTSAMRGRGSNYKTPELTKVYLIILALLIPTILFSQIKETKTKRLGVIYSYDLAYNTPDKLIKAGLERKGAIGISLTNKKREFIVSLSLGAKVIKLNFYSPGLQESFLEDVKKNYVVSNNKKDSIIGASIYNLANKVDGYSFWGTYSQFLQVGFIFNRYKIKPSFNFYYGNEQFLLFSSLLRGTRPNNPDYRYATMYTHFYQTKIGATIPLSKFSEKNYCININAGYKWADYGNIQFEQTPLKAYTSGQLAETYNKTGKLSISISFVVWSNW